MLHQGLYFRAEGGRLVPMTASISSKVIRISLNPADLRCSSRGLYLDWTFNVDSCVTQAVFLYCTGTYADQDIR